MPIVKSLNKKEGATTGLVIGLQVGYAKFVPNSGLPLETDGSQIGTAKNGGLYFAGILDYDYAINSILSVGVEISLKLRS